MRRVWSAVCVAAVSSGATVDAQCERQVLFDERPNGLQDFGESLASEEDTLVVGRFATPFFAGGAGSVHFYERSGEPWSETQAFGPPEEGAAIQFGVKVDLSGDTALVASPLVLLDSMLPGGLVHVFDRDSEGWSLTETLTLDVPVDSQGFGRALSICGDRVAVGFGETAGPEGVVHVFERDTGRWSETAVVAPRDAEVVDFGTSLDLEGDRLIVGAEATPAQVGEDVLTMAGSAHVFERTGTDWVETARLAPSELLAARRFGAEVRLDGDRAYVGAPGILTAGLQTGSVFEFTLTDGVWEQTAEVVPPLPQNGQGFGRALSADGDRLLVGAPGQIFPGPALGTAAWLYERTESGWEFAARMVPGGGDVSSEAGKAVELNGATAFVSAPQASGLLPASGIVGVYALEDSLCGAPGTVSLASGGAQLFDLNAGAARAGELYWMIGSASGTTPGTRLGDLAIPLNADGYLRFSVLFPEVFFPGTPALLDEFGSAATAFQLPPGFPASLAGLELWHAALTFDPLTLEPLFVTNAVALTAAP